MSSAIKPAGASGRRREPRLEAGTRRGRPYRAAGVLGVLLGVAVAAAFISWNRRSRLPAPSPAVAAAEYRAGPGVIGATLRLSGVTSARTYVALRAPEWIGGGAQEAGAAEAGRGIPGRIVLRSVVAPGAEVREGQVVAEFEGPPAESSLEAARLRVSEQEAVLKTERADLDSARRAREEQLDSAQAALEKARADMRKVPVLSAVDAEQTRLAFDEAQARYEQLLRERPLLKASQAAQIRHGELDLAVAKLELKHAEESDGASVVRSPIRGIAVVGQTWKDGQAGEIRAGDSVQQGEVFLRIIDPSSMVVRAAVNQVDAPRLKPGEAARIHFDAYPDLALAAAVEAVGAIAEPVSAAGTGPVRQVPVILRLNGGDSRLIPDLSVSADVELEAAARCDTVVPIGALQRDAEGHSFVYVDSGGKWVKRDVKIGRKNYLQAEVSAGLRAGDMVALELPGQAEP